MQISGCIVTDVPWSEASCPMGRGSDILEAFFRCIYFSAAEGRTQEPKEWMQWLSYWTWRNLHPASSRTVDTSGVPDNRAERSGGTKKIHGFMALMSG